MGGFFFFQVSEIFWDERLTWGGGGEFCLEGKRGDLLVRVGGDIIFSGGSRVRRNELEGEHPGS